MDTNTWIAILFGVICMAALVRLRGLVRRHSARQRLHDLDVVSIDHTEIGKLRQWLYVAGYRAPSAPTVFWILQGVALCLGLLLVFALNRSGIEQLATGTTEAAPGMLSEIARPLMDIAGLIILIFVSLLPIVWIRRAHQRRTDMIEADLPIALELLASLAKSGLGFDAAVSRIIDAERDEEMRPLNQEFEGYRSDVLSGLAREESFRRMTLRTSAPGIEVFVAALTHSERLGVGLSETLRRQADDLWNQRRERALTRAQTLPARLSLPLIACFLPGLLLIALGPSLFQFWETISGVTSGY
ncbi:MAG: type II secretion system F family protein [Planctomycetota bacterium]|nr:type II secretion system F family protein [Planctomycetota bacterium]MDG2142898.1 type II secretion system F family protein [Planctomycetota bacterium]